VECQKFGSKLWVPQATFLQVGSLIHNTSPVCEDPRCASPARRFGSPPFEIEFHRLGGLARDYHLWITSHLVSIVVSIDVSFGAE
jgi:hypothetical protein